MEANAPGSGRRLETIASNLLLETRAGEVVEALRQAGFRSILIKGPTTARWLYEDGSRPYSDVDLLVDPAGFDECERALETMGFERSAIERAFPDGRPWHASTWTRESATIDLHRTVIGLGVSAQDAWAVLSRCTETWSVGRAEVEVLNPTARSLVLALHVAQHGPDFGRTGEDLERAIARVPESTWADAGDLARRLQAETPMAIGLGSVEGGHRLCAALGLRLEGETPVAGSPSFHAAQGLLWFMRTRGTRAKAHYLKRKLFPPPAVMRARVASARTGHLALIWAYAVRLARLGRHIPASVWGLARLRAKRRRC